MTTGFERALVTGATGFIGSALSHRLARCGVKTSCLVRAGSPRAAALASALAAVPGVEVIRVSSFKEGELRTALSDVRAEVVFHLASYGVNPGERDPSSMLDGNVGLIAQLLSALAAAPPLPRRLLYTGSCSEYAPLEPPARATEAHPLRPISLYGAAKAAAHLYGSALARQLGVPFVTLRPFGVYGVGEAPHRLVPHVIDHLRRGAAPSLTAGEQVRDLTYIDDLVEALILAATAPGIEPHEVYNICSGEPVRIREVAERVAGLWGAPDADLGLGRRPYRSDEPMWVVGDSSRFRQVTGWRPAVDLTEGIRRMIACAREGREEREEEVKA